MSAGDPAVVVDGLVKRYGERTVLDGVSLSVAAGELVALLGPNGAGKTTTVEIIEGYRRADGGRTSVLGQDPATGGPALRARLGLMLQDGGIDPRARPRETLRQYGGFHADPRDADELLDLVGLQAVADTRFRRLSGGERQRLGFALALVGRPDVVILDEPTAGMDPEARVTIRSVIADLRDAGLAILLTSHDLTDVERLADRIAVLDGGRVVAAGTPAELAAGGDRTAPLPARPARWTRGMRRACKRRSATSGQTQRSVPTVMGLATGSMDRHPMRRSSPRSRPGAALKTGSSSSCGSAAAAWRMSISSWWARHREAAP